MSQSKGYDIANVVQLPFALAELWIQSVRVQSFLETNI